MFQTDDPQRNILQATDRLRVAMIDLSGDVLDLVNALDDMEELASVPPEHEKRANAIRVLKHAGRRT